MPRRLYWRPGSPRPRHELPDALKRAIAPWLWGHDGGGRDSEECHLTRDDIDKLQGFADQGVEGAKELIAAIRENDGGVVVWISGHAVRPLRDR
ncbi:hypothetical protein ACWERV_27080 [Streptomyces sp. NPDC004031]